MTLKCKCIINKNCTKITCCQVKKKIHLRVLRCQIFFPVGGQGKWKGRRSITTTGHFPIIPPKTKKFPYKISRQGGIVGWGDGGGEWPVASLATVMLCTHTNTSLFEAIFVVVLQLLSSCFCLAYLFALLCTSAQQSPTSRLMTNVRSTIEKVGICNEDIRRKIVILTRTRHTVFNTSWLGIFCDYVRACVCVLATW